MRRDLKKLAILILLPLAFLGGCKKKKPAIPPPQAQPPVITEPLPQQPPVQQPPVQPPPQPPATSTQPSQPPTTATKPKPKPHKRRAAKKPPEQKSKTVVKEGSEPPATGGQLSAGIPQDEATHQRQTTAQLRQATENSLRGITRPLSSDEQAMAQQIRAYLAQSRSADTDGDTERAYNLAVKAHLLADELMKH